MIQTSSIRKFTDYILLNACSVSSSGLYNGKTGMASALFETGNYLQDEHIEDRAFDLLQEALVTKTKILALKTDWQASGIPCFI